ncbi:MAG: sugar transferase [Oscillospiraceae bacterium]|nr:sugar transferase [Oscillospiraceae bacterium]
MDSVAVEKMEDTVQSQVVAVPKASWWYRFWKRGFDLVASLLASFLLLIPMVVIGLMVALKDFGSPFFIQKRVGQDGKMLRLFKFRSMKKNADHLEEMLTPEQLEEYHREYKLDDDPRLLGYKKAGDSKKCFGAMLRRTSLDELPQIFFNILIRGDMSVVGPRPILPEELQENYTPEEQSILLSAKPGLTGYWQAYARNNATYATHERQDMELYYVRNRSFMLDIKIILHTIVAVVSKNGAK